jgi:membrane fusion protein, multidrug efflux system
MKKTRNGVIIVVILAAVVFVKLKFLSGDTPQAASIQQGKNPASVVNVYVVKSEKLDNKIYITGTVLANEEVVLLPEVPGKVVAINFKEGSKVTKGELLVKINDADLQAQLKKLQLQEKLAADNEAREKKLLDVNGISRMEYEGVLTQLNAIQADIQLAQAQIAKTEIRAPFDGSIGLKYVSEGSYVSSASSGAASGGKIATLQQTDPVKVDFSIPEKYSSVVKQGDSIYFSIQGSDEKFKGRIYAIEPKIDLNTRTVQLRALSGNKEGKIFPGAFVKIELILKESPNSILIPTEALIPELKGQKVFLCKNGKAQAQKVDIGIRTDSHIQITGGLKPGDTVITTGIMQLKPDALVKIIERK